MMDEWQWQPCQSPKKDCVENLVPYNMRIIRKRIPISSEMKTMNHQSLEAALEIDVLITSF